MADYRMRGEIARNTLKWLVAAQRPVTVFELVAVINIARSQDDDGIFVTDGTLMWTVFADADLADEGKAVSAIQKLLGKKALEYTRQPELGNVLCARLALSFRKLEIDGEDFFDLVQEIDFTKSEAHQYALWICLGICRVTTLSFVDLRNERPNLLGLVTYAWAYWSVHQCLAYNYALPSERHLLNAALMEQLRGTFREVLFDTVMLLTQLKNGLIWIVSFERHSVSHECVLSSQDARDVIDIPLYLLMNMIKLAPVEPTREIVADLELGRRTCRNAMDLQPPGGNRAEESLSKTRLLGLHFNMFPGTNPVFIPTTRENPTIHLERARTGPSGLNTDILFKAVKGQTDLGGFTEKVVILAEAARHMRLLSMLIAQTTLSQGILQELRCMAAPPLETLMNVATFLEALACYPFWDLMPKPYSEQYFEVANIALGLGGDVFWYCYRRYDERFFIEHREDPRIRLDLSSLSYPGQKPSWVRIIGRPFLAAEANQDMPPSFNADFQSDVAAMANSDRPSSPGARILDHLHGTVILLEVGSVDWMYFLLKGAIISDGFISALAKIVMAIILNHLRTIFMPWLGVGIWQNPLEQLRLARSNPEVFLDEFHTQTWSFIMFSLAHPRVLESLALRTLAMVTNCNRFTENKSLGKHRGQGSTLCFVGYIAWLFTTVENLVSATMVYFALALAFWNLVSSGSETAHLALWMVTAKRWPKMVFIAGYMVYFLRSRLFPVLRIAYQSAAEGRIGLSLFIGGLVALVRAIILYRSFFFIALEVSGMFVAVGWFLVGCCVLFAWFWDDPLWVKHIVERAVRDGKIAWGRIEEVFDRRHENSTTHRWGSERGNGL